LTENEKRNEKNLEAYDRFVRYMRQKEYQKAFKIFNLRPGLAEHMRINEISGYYQSLQRNLGRDYANGLKIAVRGAFEQTEAGAAHRPKRVRDEGGLDSRHLIK
jgi:hypothetical protein